MAQKRYRDFQSPVASKDSMEPFTFSTGMGPKSGFNSGSYDVTLGVFTLGGVTSTGKQLRYVVDTDGTIIKPQGVVTTPDGIMTIVNDALEISIPNTSLGSTREVFVYAQHNYIESSSIETTTTFYIVVNGTTTSWVNTLLASGSNMSTWETYLTSLGITTTNSVIVGVYVMPSTSGSITSMLIPYNYQWYNGKSSEGADGEGFPTITNLDILDGTITSDKLANLAVTTIKIADLAVTNAKIAANTIGLNKLNRDEATVAHHLVRLKISPINHTFSDDAYLSTLVIPSYYGISTGLHYSADTLDDGTAISDQPYPLITNFLTASYDLHGIYPYSNFKTINGSLIAALQTYWLKSLTVEDRMYILLYKPTGWAAGTYTLSFSRVFFMGAERTPGTGSATVTVPTWSGSNMPVLMVMTISSLNSTFLPTSGMNTSGKDNYHVVMELNLTKS